MSELPARLALADVKTKMFELVLIVIGVLGFTDLVLRSLQGNEEREE